MGELKESESTEEEIEGIGEPFSDGWGDYPLDMVFVRTEQRTVAEVMSRISRDRYKLDPDFQRDFVWSSIQQSRLIESSLMRIPLPVFYVAENEDGKIVVVDGLQRLTTFFRYMKDEFQLTGLSSKDSENLISKKKFSQLPTNLQERIEDTQLTLYILDSKAPERARLDIFDRVNSGVPLTRQQMRNSLYSGPATRWLKDMSQHEDFLAATGRSLQTKSMRDREVVNRFCAFHLTGYEMYRADMDEFLSSALIFMNKQDEEFFIDLENKFLRSMRLNKEIFGPHAFRKSIADGWGASRSVLNVSLFDVFSSLFVEFADAVEEKSDTVSSAFIELLGDRNGRFFEAISLSTSSSRNVNIRFSEANSLFLEILND